MRIDSPEMFLNSLREPAAILDANGVIAAASARWSQLGIDGALAGARFSPGSDYLAGAVDLRGAPVGDDLARGARDVLAGRSPAFTLAYACERAEPPRHFEVVVSALPTADGAFALVVHYDVTAQKQIEAASREVEGRLRYVLEMVPEGYWDWNLENDHVYYSDRWCEALGYSRSEVAPHVGAWVSLIHPDDAARVLDAMRGYIAGRYPSYQCETRLRMRDGTYQWRMDRGRVVSRDARGKALRVVGLEIDITERKKAELVIKEQSRRLMDLSTPLIPISDEVVVMPLIGSLDAERADQVLSTLLHGLQQTRASVAILDITGVSLSESRVAEVLVNAAKAVQLLGAQVVLTGVRPEVATILVGLGLDWGNVVMRGTLQSGIAYATEESAARAR
jgi:anti-anti-sigma factor